MENIVLWFDIFILYLLHTCLLIIVCSIDNSEYARNGDYAPSRLQQQSIAGHMCVEAVLSRNVENKCALVKMSGGYEIIHLKFISFLGRRQSYR
jgi:hypothetical protein